MLTRTSKFLFFILLFFGGQVNASAITIEDVEAAWERDDSVAAISLLTELANETKDSEFKLALAMSYKNGWDVEVDHAKAIKWFKLAVEQNDPEAMAFYSDYYLYGKYLEKDINKAKVLLERAADMGSSEGMVRLGRFFNEGIDGNKNYNKAKQWFMSAAGKNNTTALKELGLMALLGKAEPKDYVIAYKWFSLVSIYRKDPNYVLFKGVKKKLTAEEIKKGDALVKEWLIKHPKKEEPS